MTLITQREAEEIASKTLKDAKRNKNDEFYTQLTDIEKELKYYKEQLKGKVIFLNCDNPEWSNFWKYFKLNFESLSIKKIISTHFEDEKSSYKLEYDGKIITQTPLRENGDFRNSESVELLKEADVVITNPPFSLFREYVSQLMEYDKKFLIIGSQNSITYKETFSLLKNNKIWLGYHSGGFTFRVPDTYTTGNIEVDEQGNRYAKLGNITWYTNLNTTKRHEEIILHKKYTPEEYPKYDNYDAINVNKVAEIPADYFGVMGVPITFMDKYNPDQFEIVGITTGCYDFEVIPSKKYINAKQINADGSIANGSKLNTRAALLLKGIPKKTYYIADNADGPLQAFYARILIKRVVNATNFT